MLAVCRVEWVVPGAALRRERWCGAQRRTMTAELTVLRSLPALETRKLTVHYFWYGSTQTGGVGGDVIWPSFSLGEVRVFPLALRDGQWRFAREERRNNTMPAHAEPRPGAASRNATP